MGDAHNHLLVHLSADKRDFYLNSPAIFWSDQLASWITADPTTILAVQRSPTFHVLDHAGGMERIKSRLNVDLADIGRVFENTPVNVEGEEHRERRRRMARALTARTEEALGLFEAQARELCARHLGRDGESDLVTDVFEPLVIELALALTDIALAHHPDFMSPTQIFDKSLSLNRRKLVDQEIGALRQQAHDRMPDDKAELAVATMVFVSDTTLGSLALSFMERVSSCPGMRMSDIAWGDRLTLTAVPFIERMASEALDLAGVTVQRGDVIRLFLDRFSYEAPGDRDAFFGSGRHLCLGRPIVQQAWRALARVLAELPFSVQIDRVKFRPADCMFLFPTEMMVTTSGH